MAMSKREIIKQYGNYAVIALISVIVMFIMPMFGSEVGLGLNLPDSTAGWIVWGITKGGVAIVNMLIFHCFTMQGKVNSLKDPQYIEATKILQQYRDKDAEKPKSPRKFLAEQYGFKGSMVLITTILSSVGLTQAILTFDLIQMISYGITVILGLVAGFLQMNKVEIYWTDTYYKYALLVKEQNRNNVMEVNKQ